MAISIIESSNAKYCPTSTPIGASVGNSKIPCEFSAKPSSTIEQSMPVDSTPRNAAFLICIPFGKTASTKATATFKPARALLAPQTICNCCSCPTSTIQTLKRSALGCCSAVIINPTTTLLKPLLS